MSKIKPTAEQISELDNVKQQFAQWRSTKTKRERIPDHLWHAGAALVHAGGCTLNEIAKELRLNHSDFKKRVYGQPSKDIFPVPSQLPTFIELESPSSFPECVIEMENSSGTKMRMCFRGNADVNLKGAMSQLEYHGTKIWNEPDDPDKETKAMKFYYHFFIIHFQSICRPKCMYKHKS